MFDSIESHVSSASAVEKAASPMLRIAIPAWTIRRQKIVKKAPEPVVTEDELKSLFQVDLKRRGIRNRLTDNERHQLDINQRLRNALMGAMTSA